MTTDPTHEGHAAGSHSQPSQHPASNPGQPGGSQQGPQGQKNPYFDFTGYQLRMPTVWPKSVRDVLPSFRGGIGTVFQTAHMPMDARIGYWIWLVGCALSIIGWVFSIGAILVGILVSPLTLVGTGMMSLFGEIRWGVVVFSIVSMLLTLVMVLVQLILTLKIRERTEWARMALTALTVLTIVYSIILTVVDMGSGGASTVLTSFFSLLLIAFFWMPRANDWFLRADEADGTATAAGGVPPTTH